MNNDDKYALLIKKAQLRDRQALVELTELAEQRLREDIYRLTLKQDLVQDIIQETLLEMVKIIGNLKDPDRFWPWLYRIALNKIRRHHRSEQVRKTVAIDAVDGENIPSANEKQAINKLVGDEIKDIVVNSIQKLSPRHRTVITLRCYRDMPYAEIAESMECSEFAARMLFQRAKKTLQKQLSRHGLGKGALAMSLLLFGKMTATSEASAAAVTITSASLNTGVAATVATAAISKTTATLTAASVMAVGAAVTLGPVMNNEDSSSQDLANSIMPAQIQTQQVEKENTMFWYFTPDARKDTVLMRTVTYDADGNEKYCKILQNGSANYAYDAKSNTININNYNAWNDDLSVWQLPTDSIELRRFISKAQGIENHKHAIAKKIRSNRNGLLTAVKSGPDMAYDIGIFKKNENLLDEELFRYSWTSRAKTSDNRDEMHLRGWTFFKFSGQIDGKRLKGIGRVPLTYDHAKRHFPWLKLRYDNKRIAGKKAEVFFSGLSRPWTGLHTIDTIRRDAAKNEIDFETRLLDGGDTAQVVLSYGMGSIIYTVDMLSDLLESIEIQGETTGFIQFSYLQNVDNAAESFTTPRTSSYAGITGDQGPLWLLELASPETY